jgi:hypothetical protein
MLAFHQTANDRACGFSTLTRTYIHKNLLVIPPTDLGEFPGVTVKEEQ